MRLHALLRQPPGRLVRAPLRRERPAMFSRARDQLELSRPAQTHPVQTRLVQTRLVQTRPAQTRPAQTRSAQTRSAPHARGRLLPALSSGAGWLR